MNDTVSHYLLALFAIYLSLFIIKYVVVLQEMPTFLRLFRDVAPEPFDAQPVKFALMLAIIMLPLAFVGVLPTLAKRGLRYFEPMAEDELQDIVSDLVSAYEQGR